MATTLIVRTLRTLPLYLVAVVTVLGLTQLLHGTSVAAAEPQPFVPASAPIQVTFVIGQVPMPVPVLVPPSQH